MTLQHKFHPPSRRSRRRVGAPATRAVVDFLLAMLVVGLAVALAGTAGQWNRPSTEVRGEVELINDTPRLEVTPTAPEVAIIDAVCITNTPTHEPC
jgi:hypothetical protein